MKKATVIATCLVNSSICGRSETGEEIVRRVFAREYPGKSFVAWNLELSQSEADYSLVSLTTHDLPPFTVT